LKWTPGESNAKDPNGRLGIFTAVEVQLGLKQEPKKGHTDVPVIDRVKRPSEN